MNLGPFLLVGPHTLGQEQFAIAQSSKDPPSISRWSLAWPRILSADLKQTDTTALRIYYVEAITGVDPHGQRVAKVRALDGAWIKCVEPLPVVTEDPNLVKLWIANVNIALVVDCQSGAIVCVGQTNCPPEMACCIEDLNACVPHIDHEQFATAHRQLARVPELARSLTTTALPDLANKPPAVVHNNDHVPKRVGDVNAARNSIDRDTRGTLEI